LERCDAIRKPQRFEQVLQACECDARGRLGKQEEAYPQARRLQRALEAALAVPTASIAAAAQAQGQQAEQIGQAIAAERVKALSRTLLAI
jgi:tRNA nucleotidyltransferase (CCA-adding enzyme)